tara:strand:- start:821 stop:1057 length:237 start_codon:yes stop_codon:yes gene_type:complete
MELLKEEISEKFIESMVDRVIARLSAKFDELDISLDYIGAILGDESAIALGATQKSVGRHTRRRRYDSAPPRDREPMG